MRRPIIERVAISLDSDDLRLLSGPCDLDKIIVSGWVGRKALIGVYAFRAKYVCDAKAKVRLIEAVAHKTHKRFRAFNRGASRIQITDLAATVVSYWLDDKCPRCKGVKFEVVDQIATDLPCHHCQGTGLKVLPSAHECASGLSETVFDKSMAEIIETLDISVDDYIKRVVMKMQNRATNGN